MNLRKNLFWGIYKVKFGIEQPEKYNNKSNTKQQSRQNKSNTTYSINKNSKHQRKKQLTNIQERAIFSCISQNVRGFLKRKEWFQEFKKKDSKTGNFPEIILIQEAHIKQNSQMMQIRKEWNAVNGIYREKETFWSSSTEKAEQGVALLINPHSNEVIKPILQESWNARRLFMVWEKEDQTIIIINVYAPNTIKEREVFFQELSKIPLPKHNIVIMGGDFNYTENDIYDREREKSSKKRNKNCIAMEFLKTKWNIVDVIHHINNKATSSRMLTFYGPHGGARLDRFYISTHAHSWIQSLDTSVPSVKSDHLQIKLNLKNPKVSLTVKKQVKVYPSLWTEYSIEVKLVEKQLKLLISKFENEIGNRNVWDELKREFRLILKEQKRCFKNKFMSETTEELKKKKKQTKKSMAVEVRVKLLKEIVLLKKEKRIKNSEIKYRKHLFDPTNGHKGLFKRVNNRDSSAIPILNGEEYATNANRMAEEWKKLMSKTNETRGMRRQQQQLLRELEWETISEEESKSLESPISAEEVKQAIKSLKRNKSGGDDLLPNDFYIDFQDLLIPILVKVFNRFWNLKE